MMSHSTFARITFFVLYQKLSFAAQPIQPSSPFVAFEALGGVDDAAECRRAVDADILEFVTVAVVRRLMGHARIERIAPHTAIVSAHLPTLCTSSEAFVFAVSVKFSYTYARPADAPSHFPSAWCGGDSTTTDKKKGNCK